MRILRSIFFSTGISYKNAANGKRIYIYHIS